MRSWTGLITACFIFISCGPSIQYLGRTYPPTNNVDIYFRVADVKKPFEVMGTVDGKAWPLTGFSKIQASIEQEAKKRGADGVIFLKSGEQVVGTTVNSTTTSTGSSTTTTTGNAENGSSTTTGWNSSISTPTTITQQTENYVNAEFIKYTN